MIFTPEMLAQLQEPQGSIVFRTTLDQPVGQQATPAALLETPPDFSTIARVEVGPGTQMSFLHAPAGEQPRVARVDLHSLEAAQALQVFLVWSPEEARLHVGGVDKPGELLNASSAS